MVNTSNWDKFSKRIVLGLIMSALVAAVFLLIGIYIVRRRRGSAYEPRDAFGIIGGLEHLEGMRSGFPLPVKADMRELASICR